MVSCGNLLDIREFLTHLARFDDGIRPFCCKNGAKSGRLSSVIRLATVVLGVAVVAAIVYCTYYYRVELGIVKPQNQASGRSAGEAPAVSGWQTVDRPGDGFRVQMPSGAIETRVPAYASDGTVKMVDTIEASPDADITFAVSWSDDPPVSQAGGADADLTLDLARDGALARTQTRLTGESRSSPGGYTMRDFAGRNDAGGVLSARFILAGTRLYMLTAVLPASASRHNDDVSHFFNSFILTGSSPAN
jgi:hypothetical protein